MPSYHLLSYAAEDGPRAGLTAGERLVDAAEATGVDAYASVLDILRDWERAEGRLEAAAANGDGRALAGVMLLAPLAPGAIFCAGANYADHVREMAHGEPPPPDPHTQGLKPWHFIKVPQTVVGPNAAVPLPRASQKVDWEVELVAVIGRRAKDVALADALDYVAGYAIANDLSARDLGWRPPLERTSPFFADWVGHKNFDGSCPLGPWITPAKQIGDPQALAISLAVNGVVKQDSNTAQMIFTTAEQISHLSTRVTLQPGDIVLTGTPAGVGAGRGEFLASGDVLTLTIEKIGTLTHTMV